MLDTPASLISRIEPTHVHRFATCWLIERKDGVELGFTDHNCRLKIPLNGVDSFYTPVGAFSASAYQKQVGLKERNQEVRGAITSEYITHEDLKGGRYRDAKVTEMLVDWQATWLGPFYTNVYYILSITFDAEVWTAQLIGAASRLIKPVGRLYTRNCRHNVGDSGCKVNLGPHTHTGAVTAIHSFREKFESNLTQPDNYFVDGNLTWLTGANAGIKGEVQAYANTDGIIDLYIRTPSDIAPGDTFSVYRGCDRTIGVCDSVFDNVINYGGFPFIPGNDRLIFVPDAK